MKSEPKGFTHNDLTMKTEKPVSAVYAEENHISKRPSVLQEGRHL
jgi:hypothetical protein